MKTLKQDKGEGTDEYRKRGNALNAINKSLNTQRIMEGDRGRVLVYRFAGRETVVLNEESCGRKVPDRKRGSGGKVGAFYLSRGLEPWLCRAFG